MRNKFAIALTVVLLLVTMAGLAATIVAVWPDDVESTAVAPEFTPIEVAPSQGDSSFIGPQLPDDSEATARDDAKASEREEKTQVRAKGEMTERMLERRARKAAEEKRRRYKPAVLQVVTNFALADVTVNGLPYPEYYEPDEAEGMVLPAGGPYHIEVKFGENTKVYSLHLRPHETRLLLVELSGYNSGAPPPKAKPAPAKKAEPKKAEEEKKDEKESGGKITVYSKPAGTVIVDGKETGDKTPGTVDLENGRHEVQVKYESGTVSEKKIVRVRNGSRIKLFFRERTN